MKGEHCLLSPSFMFFTDQNQMIWRLKCIYYGVSPDSNYNQSRLKEIENREYSSVKRWCLGTKMLLRFSKESASQTYKSAQHLQTLQRSSLYVRGSSCGVCWWGPQTLSRHAAFCLSVCQIVRFWTVCDCCCSSFWCDGEAVVWMHFIKTMASRVPLLFLGNGGSLEAGGNTFLCRKRQWWFKLWHMF